MNHFCLVLALVAAACVPMAPQVRGGSTPSDDSRRTVASLDDLRTRDGVCVKQRMNSVQFGPMIYTVVTACAYTGAPMDPASASRSPILFAVFDGSTTHDANPGNWAVTIVGPDGNELVNRQELKKEIPDVGACDTASCRHRGSGMTTLPAAWAPGVYRIIYALTFDNQVVADMTLELKPGSEQRARIFTAKRAPYHPWDEADEGKFVDQCAADLAKRYKTARTQDQLRYACECIGWGIQDRYSLTEYADGLRRPAPNEAGRATQEIAAECKRTRPASLGPDPGP